MSAQKHILKQLKMGTTEILVLAILTQGDRYGYEISKEVFKRSKGFFEFKHGFLYPALNRMKRSRLVKSYWKESGGSGPDRKYYRITRAGQKRLQTSAEAWALFSKEFNRMLAVAKKSR